MEVRLPILRERGYVPFHLFNMNSKLITISSPSIAIHHANRITTPTPLLLIPTYPKIALPPFSRLICMNQNAQISINFIQPMYEYSPANTTQNFYKNTTPNEKLWTQSQITVPFVSPNLSFSKEKRFKWSSIYWPENNQLNSRINYKHKSDINEMALKVSKLIDQQQKNQARIKQLKRHFSIGKSSTTTPRKDSASMQSTKKPFKLSKQNERVLNKLMAFEKKKQSLLRDRHGNRCNLFDNPQEPSDQQQKKSLGRTTGFSTSRKIKLELPHNYFPGPGTYEIPRYLSELEGRPYSVKERQNSPSEKTAK